MIIINPKNNQTIKLNTSLAKKIIKNYILYIKMKNTTYQCKKIKNSKFIKKKTNKTNKTRQSKDISLVRFWILILISGFLGLLASSLIFNLVSDSFQKQTPKQELINKTK